MSEDKNYTKYSLWVTLLVIVMMLGLSFVPPFSVGGVHFKRTNILSEVIAIGNDSVAGDELDDSADRHFIEEMERREAEQLETMQRVVDSIAAARPVEPREQSWLLASDGTQGKVESPVAGEQPAVVNGQYITKIEDYSDGLAISIGDFCRLLGTETAKRTVRIAFLGDSYIEGDIITADVRDQLQALYGGNGVGFVPFSTPLAANRPTIKHKYAGWVNYNLAQKKNAPEELGDKFFVSGTLSVPDGNQAWSEYETTGYRKHVAQSQAARVIFENAGHSTIKLTVNDTIERSFTPDPGSIAQQIRVGGLPIKKMRVDISGTEGFIGYGVSFEDSKGVVVDNYSIRSNSGLGMFGTSLAVNKQIDRMLGYDLIVLQYGLNAMDPNIVNYAGYGENMRRMVNYIKGCFPNAAVLVLGVGDRSTQENGQFATMPAVKAMIKEQRRIAKDCSVAFWDIFAAMGGENSMADFVEKGWAAKDYTHLSFGGGRHIAKQMVNALLYVKQSVEAGGDEASAEYLVSGEQRSEARAAGNIHDLSASPLPTEMLEGEEITLENLAGPERAWEQPVPTIDVDAERQAVEEVGSDDELRIAEEAVSDITNSENEVDE